MDLAALRQGLRLEKWCNDLPIGWIPGALQKGDLTKPQNPTEWWEMIGTKLLLPLAIAEGGALISNRVIRHRTRVKLEGIPIVDGMLPYEFAVAEVSPPFLGPLFRVPDSGTAGIEYQAR